VVGPDKQTLLLEFSMKKIALIFLGFLVFGSTSVAADEALATKSGCMACHKVDAKVVGPAFKDVAAKYDAGQADALAKKVKAGSTPGEPLVWGAVAMPANTATSEADIKKVVEWVLTLK
jgi:cytochrome c